MDDTKTIRSDDAAAADADTMPAAPSSKAEQGSVDAQLEHEQI
jgi:hypothetical protein